MQSLERYILQRQLDFHHFHHRTLIKARHLLLHRIHEPARNDDKKIKDLGNKLVAQLRNHGDFGKVAKQFSKASSAENGGDVSWVRIGQLPDELSDLVQNMKVGDISNPIKTQEGYTIFKINNKRTSDPLAKGAASNVELRSKIRESLMMKKLEIQANRYLRELRRGYFIEVRM